MKKLFLYLVAIVFVLVSYGFSEARKLKVHCNLENLGSSIYLNFRSMRGVDPENLIKKGSKSSSSIPVTVEIKTKKRKVKKIAGSAYYHTNKERSGFWVRERTQRIGVKGFNDLFGKFPEMNCYASWRI